MKVGPESSVAGALIRRWNLDTETDTWRGEGHVATGAEFQMLQLHIQECQGLMATTRKWQRQEGPASRDFRGAHPADTLMLGFWVLEP